MKIVLVNVKDTNRPEKYWYASEKELSDTAVVVSHDNEIFRCSYHLVGFYDSPEKPGRKEFILSKLPSEVSEKLISVLKLRNVNLKGVQGVKYVIV